MGERGRMGGGGGIHQEPLCQICAKIDLKRPKQIEGILKEIFTPLEAEVALAIPIWEIPLPGQGTDLRLAIAKQLITHPGGKIWAESKLGHGSTFVFALPA